MNKMYRMMSVLVVFGLLMAAIWFWAVVADLDSSRAIVLRADFLTPAAMPAPTPQHASVVRANRLADASLAQNTQPLAVPAPAYPK